MYIVQLSLLLSLYNYRYYYLCTTIFITIYNPGWAGQRLQPVENITIYNYLYNYL